MEVVECVSNIVNLCISCSQNEEIAKKYGYLRRPTRSIRKLNNLLQKLDAHKEDVQDKLSHLWHLKGTQSTNVCNSWLKQVDQVHKEVSSLIDENGQLKRTIGRCSICSRIKVGESIEEKIRDINDLLENVPHLDDSMSDPVRKRGDFLSAAPMVEYGMTHKQVLMKTWAFLFDKNVRRIGVWGMGGVGKTTIMSEINNRLMKERNEFNCIIWVEASKDLEKLQHDIAVKLGLTFQETDDERVRASKLLEAFNRRKTFALILDDVWEPFPLERVGIPIPTVDNGCKLVIISRNLRTCREMETDKDVEVTVLSENEVWNLFKDKVGDEVLSFPTIELLARDVAKECGGLPLAIVTVGRALRNSTNTAEWENALEELRTSSIDTHNFDEVLFSRLKLSYSKLRDDTRRSCFLFCALYPERYLIDTNELMNYWRWEGLLGGSVSKSGSRRKGESILFELGDACLLEYHFQNGIKCVKLHDLVRGMAIEIMRTAPRCIVNAGMGVARPPNHDEWVEDAQWVSLMRNDVKSISFNPRCPILTYLLLQYNSFDKNLSDGFFDNMQDLKVLDLSYTGITSLPVSLSNLGNLCALLLSHCWNLVEVPSVAKLTKLQHLDLSFSRKLIELPRGMEHLYKLRHLDFSSTSIQNLPTGMISKFSLLEDLLTVGSPMIGASSKAKGRSLFSVSIEELTSCRNMTLLHMQFLNIEAYLEYATHEQFSQLNEFRLVVGFQDVPNFCEKTSLAIAGDYRTRSFSEVGITALIPRNVMELKIQSLYGINRLSMHLLDVMCLKSCDIVHCDGMECILESEENELSTVERMFLSDLRNLKMICRKSVKPRTLMNLKVINVEVCDSLKSLFPWQLMLELTCLEEITIRGCDEMEEIIEGERNINAEDSSHAAKVILPKLQRLKLGYVRSLKRIYNGVIQCNSLRSIEVRDCRALKKLPLGLFGLESAQQILSSTSLEEIKCSKDWWESLEWDAPDAKHLLQPYFVDLYRRDKFAPSGSGTK